MKDKKVGNVIKTEAKVIAYVVICLVIIVLGISYALFFEVKGNEKNQIVKAGTLEFTYETGSQITNEANSDCFIPMSNEEALSHSECEYKVSITNTGTLPGNYNINLNSESVENPIELSKLKIILKKEGEVVSDYPKEGTTTSLVENEKIEAGSVINYSVQVYVDESLVDANDDEKNISLKINGDAVVNSEEINPAMTAGDYIKNIPTTETGDGLYIVTHDNLEELGQEWNKKEYRYAGSNPNNYVRFNNEKWRIIGLVNVKTESGIEQRVKIVRTDGIDSQLNFGDFSWTNTNYNNDWLISSLKNMLNGIYYNSESGNCYKGSEEAKICDFSNENGNVKGINDNARIMIDSNIIWNLGRYNQTKVNSDGMYEKERLERITGSNNYQFIWSKGNDANFNGIGLIYPSDYGYAAAVEGNNNCLNNYLSSFYENDCNNNHWLKKKDKNIWLLTTLYGAGDGAYHIESYGIPVRGGYLITNYNVWPTLYLKLSVKIVVNSNPDQEYGSIDNPFVLI